METIRSLSLGMGEKRHSGAVRLGTLPNSQGSSNDTESGGHGEHSSNATDPE